MQELKRVVVAFAVLLALSFVLSEAAFAQDVFGKAQSVLEKIAAAFSSGFVKAIATLAIIGFGFMMLFGQLDFKRGLMICIGCGVILGASAISSALVS
jgi:type IV secretory pathway VirB2 component (pilin)